MIRHEVAWESQDLPRLMELSKRPIIIHKRRQSGGTTELLRFMQKHHGANFVVITPNWEMERNARSIWHMENGFEITLANETIPEPVFISAIELPHALCGGPVNQFVVVDEWNMLSDAQQGDVLDCERFRMAVTS